MENKESPIIILSKENLIQSILMDMGTFTFLGGMFYLNYHYFGNSWFVAFILFIIIIMQLSALKPNRRFYNIDSAIKYLESLKKED